MAFARKIMIEIRSKIENRIEKDAAIRARFFENLPDGVERCFIYASSNQEADTKQIITDLFERGIRVFCPRVNGQDMAFFEILSYADLAPGYHQIDEPVLDTETRTFEEIAAERATYPTMDETDLCVVPGLIFDENGGRMGYGFGFYDRFLGKNPCRKVALAYEVQVQPRLMETLNDRDIRMDMLITDEKVRTWRRAADEN